MTPEQCEEARYALAVENEKLRARLANIDSAIQEASVFCFGCAQNKGFVVPPRSDVVGLAAVHSNGMICIPNTIKALIAEKGHL